MAERRWRGTGPRPWGRFAAAGVVALVLGWQILAAGLSSRALLQGDPESAATIAGWSADAHSRGAAVAMRDGKGAEAFARARRAVSLAPIDPRALAIMGSVVDAAGNREEAGAYMMAAGAFGWRDRLTQLWLMRVAAESGDARVAVQRADALLRQNVMSDEIFAVLRALLRDPAANAEIVGRLVLRPRWRPVFLGQASQLQSDEIAGFALMLERLIRSPAPPTLNEANAFLVRLVAADRDLAAWRLWQRLGGTAPIDDGGFERSGDLFAKGNGGPFGWHAPRLLGSNVAIGEPDAPIDGKALHLRSDGLAAGRLLYQTMLLPAGRYRLTARVRAAEPRALAAFEWQVACLEPAPAPLPGRSATSAGSNGWAVLRMDFETGSCTVQQLRVDVAPDGRPASIWIDDVALVAG